MSARVLVHRPVSDQADETTGLFVVDDAAVAARLAALAGLEQLPGLVVHLGDSMVSVSPGQQERQVRSWIARGLARVGHPVEAQQRALKRPETLTGGVLREQLSSLLTAKKQQETTGQHRRLERQHRREEHYEAAEA